MFDDRHEDHSQEIRLELQLLSCLPHHDNVVPFLGFKKNGASLSLVMPWMSDGTLTSFICTHGAALGTAASTTLSHDISSGLEHLHSNLVVHGNLESDNVLITEQHSAVLSGFRQSVMLSSRDAACPSSQMPPKPAIRFAGPEWFVKDDKRFQPLSKSLLKSDIFSLGCLVFYIFTKCMPWDDATSMDISNQLRECKPPPRPKDPVVDNRQWALIEPCLSLLPKDRPSALDVLRDIKQYLVFIGPPDLTEQIKMSQLYPKDAGGYGLVYEGIWIRETGGKGVKVAIKVLRVENSSSKKVTEERLKRELAAWRRLSHPNIVSLLGTMTGFGSVKGMVSLWMEKGSLDHYFKSDTRNDVLPRQRLLWGIAEGLKCLHEFPMIHGDLTPSNVLIDDEGRAVLTDFGLSVILGGVPNLSCTYTDAKPGTIAWAAPELLLDETSPSGKEVQSESPGPESDMYSFAYLMYLIFTGSHPWDSDMKGRGAGMRIMLRARKGERPSKPGNIDARHWSLIEQCWAQVPSSRPKISDVLLRLSSVQK
ncbi:kinase-like domain-containing protein [Suillus paluster]|uniref:kinase-like domain-containing protein n=1 Tax=Suillus paluster TaxID=48578 RepID=UPI001B87E9BE|nr:kinase-like domain-containing protein [Suillus paluster]KAG1731178.1 kinase-like domain-containing protein [Suillus paluster]